MLMFDSNSNGIRNPFSVETYPERQPASPYDEREVMSGGVRSLVASMQRSDSVDPYAAETARLTQQKTQLAQARDAAKLTRDKFLSGEGEGLFATNPTSGKPMLTNGAYTPLMAGNLDTLRAKSQEKVGFLNGVLTGTVGDPTDEAKAASAALAEQDPIYKAKMDKWQRIQDQLKRVQDAHDATELQLGDVANRRLQAAGVLGTPDASGFQTQTPAGPTPQPVQPQTSGGTMTRNGMTTVVAPNGGPASPYSDMNGAGVLVPAQPILQSSSVVEQQPHTLSADGSIPSFDPTYTRTPNAAETPVAPTATQPGAGPAVQPAYSGPSPLALVKLNKQIQDNAQTMDMETTSPALKDALTQKNQRLSDMFDKGLAALPSDDLRQRVISYNAENTPIGMAAAQVGSDALDNIKRMAKAGVKGVGDIITGAARLSGESSKALDRINELTAQAFGINTTKWTAAQKVKRQQDTVQRLADAQSVKDLSGFYQTNPRRDSSTTAQVSEMVGSIAPTIATAYLGVPTMVGSLALQMGESTRSAAIANGEPTDVADAKGKVAAAAGAIMGVIPGVPTRAGAGILEKVATHAAAGGGLMAIQDAALQAALNGKVDWGTVMKSGAFGAIVGAAFELPGAIDHVRAKNDPYIKAATDFGFTGQRSELAANGWLLNAAREAGFTGRNINSLQQWVNAHNEAVTARVAAIQGKGQGVASPAPADAANTPAIEQGATPGENDAPSPTSAPPNPTAEAGTVTAPSGETPAAPAPPVASTDGKTVQQWTFTDKAGKPATVTATGLKDAISKLPEGYTPDLRKPPTQEAIAAPQDHATPQDLQGKPINDEYTAFSPESQSLGIPRAEMPQIKSEARGALTQFLAARGIDHTEEEVLPGSLKPTQAEYSEAKVQKARTFTGGDRAIIVSADNHVVDGHHQWMASLHDEPNKPIRVIRLNAPIKDVLANVNEFPSVKQAAGATDGESVRLGHKLSENPPVPKFQKKAVTDLDSPGGFKIPGPKPISQPENTLAEQTSTGLESSTKNSQPTSPPAGNPFTLSRKLSGAKPRYSYGPKQFTLKFANDLDRATYILAQDKRSARDADFLKEVTNHTGMSEADARAAGAKVRATIKGLAKNAEPGELSVPSHSQAPAPVAKGPAIARGTNTPSTTLNIIAQSAGLKSDDRAHKFLARFLGRIGKSNPTAFNAMEVHVLNQKEWDAHPEVGSRAPDSAGAYNPSTNTLYLNSDKNLGEAVVDTIVHEAGHFAEKYVLGEKFTQGEWEKLSFDQRAEAAKQYFGKDHDGTDLLNNRQARSEWVAMQFARVVRGETEGMSLTLKTKLEKFLDEVRQMVRRWVGSPNLTTKDLDDKIRDILEYNEEPTARTEPTQTEPMHKPNITDFGEKIVGAKKELWGRFGEAIRADLPDDVASITLAKNFPEPNYEVAIKNGASVDNLATFAALRSLIPRKPSSRYKLSRWGELVKSLHSLMGKVVDGDFSKSKESMDSTLKKIEPHGGPITRRINLFRGLGYPLFTKAGDWSIDTGRFGVFNGVHYENHKQVTYAEKDGRAVYSISSDNPDEKAAFDEVVTKLRPVLEAATVEKKSTETNFGLFRDRRTGHVFIGKRGVNGIVRIKSGFSKPEEARTYLRENRDDIAKTWEEMKAPPQLRRAANNAREGIARRAGDVTPEVFQDTFGFRGVQFGNYVEGNRRQADLNETYDAFTDMAEAIGVPPKALSLDGSLGLAFGARGAGAHVAHYEPGLVVINITKKRGPGSLAHEWFHSLDNYFARIEQTGSTEARPVASFATHAFSPAEVAEPKNVRPQVWDAFKKIRDALAEGPFAERSNELDATRSKAYYGTTIEKAARAFETYVEDRLSAKDISNDYLVNINKAESRPYPSKDEMDSGIRAAYDNLFNTLEVRTDTETGATLGTPSTSNEAPEKSQSPRTERSAGNAVDDQFYDARSHDLIIDEAAAHEKAVGKTQALADALDRNNRSLRDDTKEAIRFLAMDRVSKKMVDPKTSENEQLDLARELQRISTAGNPLTRETAQALSSRQLYQRDQRVAAPVQHVDEVTKRQNNAIGEDGKNVVDDAESKIEKVERDVANTVAKQAKEKVDAMDASVTVWEEYRADAAQRMVDLLDDRANLPEPTAALADFTDRVISEMRKRIEPLLPEKPKSEQRKLSAMEVMTEAVKNREKYQDVFDTVREQFVKEFGEHSAAVDLIDMELANMGERPYSNTNLTKAINEAISAMGLKASELARQHVTRTNATAANLAKGLINEAGLSPSDAKNLAADLDKTARDLIQKAREKALTEIKNKHARGTKRAKKVADALSKVTSLNNLGALTRSDLMEAVAKELKLPTVKPEQLRKIAELADKVETAPNELARARAEYDLMAEMRIVKGITAADVGLSVWFSNMLSGLTTQMANAQGNSILSTLQLATVMATNPRNARNALSGWIDGISDGFLHGKDIMKTGRSLREMGESKTGEFGNVLETVDYARDFERLPAVLASALQKHASVMKYVSRAMRAADAVFYYPAREGYARVATAKILEGQYSGEELHAKIRESLGIAPDQFIKWERQATQEGWTGMDKALRVSQLIEGHRNSTEQGREIEQSSEQFGRESTLNQDPVGIAGIVYRIARDASVKLPTLRLFLPFLRVPTNLFNTSLNFTPVGALRAKFGVKDAAGRATQHFTQEESARMYLQAIGGTLAMAGLAGLALAALEDSKDPWFSITAKGTGDWGKNQQLEQTGWRPFTLKFGNVYWSYKDSPLLLPLAAIGQVVDAKRFQKTKDTLAGKNPYLNAMIKLPQTIFETSMLSGLGTLMDIASGNTSPAKIEGFIANSATSAVVPNLIKQVDHIASPERRASDGIAGSIGQSIPGLRETGSVQTDVLGENIKTSPFDRFASLQKHDPLREVLQKKNVFLSTPSRSTKLGDKPMDEETYREYLKISGERIRTRLEPLVGLFSGQSPEFVENMVDKIVTQERHIAKEMLRAKSVQRSRPVFNPFSGSGN